VRQDCRPVWAAALGARLHDRRATEEVLKQLADGIDMIVRGVKSGLPLNQCLQIIAKESPEPLRGEFQRLVDGQAMGVPLEQRT
jgi:Flp pilus assembly protein TadB